MENIRTAAEADLAFTLEDNAGGFGWLVNVTDPAGNTADLYGVASEIAELIDPDTGQSVSGRYAKVTLRLASVYASALDGIPRGIPDESSKPWVYKFNDINGNLLTYKVIESRPDRTLGVVTSILEGYKE